MAQVAGQIAVGAATSFLSNKLGGGGSSGGGGGGGGGQGSGTKDAGSEMYYPDLPGLTIADTKVGTLPDTSLQQQAALWDIANKQAEYNQYVSAALDRTQREFYTDQDIRRQRAAGTESRLNYMVQGEQARAGQRIQGQERRAELAESGAQSRASARVAGQEQRAGFAEQGAQQRASARVAGQELRAGMAEGVTQQRATRRVEGEEVRATDLQREMFRRYKEARDYGQAQSAYKA